MTANLVGIAASGEPEQALENPLRPRSRLFHKFVLLFVALVGSALLASGTLELWFSYQENKTALAQVQQEKALAAASRIEQFIADIARQINWTSRAQWSSSGVEQRRLEYLRLLSQTPAITEVSHLDSDGREQLRISRLAVDAIGSGADLSSEPGFTQAKAASPWFSPVYFRRESEPYMTVAIAGTGRDAGVTVAEVNLKFIWDVISRIKVGNAGYAFVVDSRGWLIAHPDIGLVLRQSDLSGLPQVAEVLNSSRQAETGEPARVGADVSGRSVLTANTGIAPLDWTVFVELPLSEAYAPLYASLMRTAALMFLGLGVAVAVGLFLARRMVGPITALQEGAVRIGQGDFGHRIDIRTGDEIESLAERFNEMAAHLQQSYETLEHKVEERTSELSEALERQTATSNILRVISSSPTDIQPVFDAIVKSAVDLCDGVFGCIFRFDGELIHLVGHNLPPDGGAVMDQAYPLPLSRDKVQARAITTREPVNIADVVSIFRSQIGQRELGYRSVLVVPMLRDNTVIGTIGVSRLKAGQFPEKQVKLLQTFSDQAVIAIENVRLFTELDARNRELNEALEYQTATSDVLNVISRSPTELQPVLDVIVETAARLCAAEYSYIARSENGALHMVAEFHVVAEHVNYLIREPIRVDRGAVIGRVALEKRTIHVPDVLADPEFDRFEWQKIGKQRAVLGVPLLREGILIGVIILARTTVEPFTQRQIELVTTFADQAVIAIENARLFDEVQARTCELETRTEELSEALERQTATGEVLNVISRSPSDLRPVLEAIVATAARLCEAEWAVIFKLETDGRFHITVSHSNDEFVRFMAERPVTPDRGSVTGRTVIEAKPVHVVDVLNDPEYTQLEPQAKGGYRTALGVPLMRGTEVIGVIFLARRTIEPFADKQIELVSTFADQGVIAIENARLFEALQSAVAEFNAVLDNIDYGVLFMDKDLRARIVNPALRRLWDIPQELIDQRPTMRELLEYNRDKGVYTTPAEEWDAWVAARIDRVRQGSVPPGEFIRADGKVYSYQCVALPDGGRMLSYFDITELKNKQAELMAAKEAAETTLAELRMAQERLVQSEKLASLGQLTAGIAHEIKNPLNFVNNFASLSRDLLEELEATVKAPIAALDAAERDEAEDLLGTVRENLDKIAHHGKRADSIVKNMLLHARQGSGEWREADINAIAEEALNLAYHGARAGHPDFNVEIVKNLDPEVGVIECCPQDIMRVVLNLVSNGIYAANKKSPAAPAGFVPRIELSTRALEAGVALEVQDNGTGIPEEIRDSIFLPFFTTKPAGEGTGLGLSLSHDIVVKQHGGSFLVESEPGEFTSFRIVLPRHAASQTRAAEA